MCCTIHVSCISPFKNRTVLCCTKSSESAATRPFALEKRIANHAEQRPHDRSALEKQNRQANEGLRSSCPATAGFVSGGRVRPEGPKERGDALRARSKMRGDPPFRVGERRLTRPPGSWLRRRRPPHPTRFLQLPHVKGGHMSARSPRVSFALPSVSRECGRPCVPWLNHNLKPSYPHLHIFLL